MSKLLEADALEAITDVIRQAEDGLGRSLTDEEREGLVDDMFDDSAGDELGSIINADGKDCGTGAGGFKEGNTCAGSGDGKSSGRFDLSHPLTVLGDVPVRHSDFGDYLVANDGREWKAGKLPDDVERGTPRECFRNATLLMLERRDLDYCEGIAYVPSLKGLGFLHAWCVDKEGNVVDNTWDRPEECEYYGVKYSRMKYLAHIQKTGMFGVFGGSDKVARKVLKKGGL